jgi:hypothetical protein
VTLGERRSRDQDDPAEHVPGNHGPVMQRVGLQHVFLAVGRWW